MPGKNNRFRWTEKIEEPAIRKNVEDLLENCGRVASFNRQRIETEPSDYEGARQDLCSAIEAIYKSGGTGDTGKNNNHNPLWDTMMRIRPEMLKKRVPNRFVYIIQQELWKIFKASGEEGDQKKVDFFEVLGKQMAEKPIYCWRALISGGVVVEWKKDGSKVFHCFPIRIPREIAQEVGLKLTTKLDNIQTHKAAVAELRKRNLVPEKVGEALQVLAEDLYTYLERGRT